MSRGWKEIGLACCLMVVATLALDVGARAQDAAATKVTPASETREETATAESTSAGIEKPSVKAGVAGKFAEQGFGMAESGNDFGTRFLRDFVGDQKAIWTSPKDLKLIDADWLLPLGAAMGGMLATDREYSRHLSDSPSRLELDKNFANYGTGAMALVGGGMYAWGKFTHDDHKRETGYLAAEAVMDSLAATYALNYTLGREGPLTNDARGDFWKGGHSFPAGSAAAAWSIAGVIAHEYPGPLTTTLAYGLASAISVSSINGKQHFASDVLAGSAMGWFIAQRVYRRHHDPEIGGGEWEKYAEKRESGAGGKAGSVGSPYVELDSWVYPALERLAGMGFIDTAFLGMRPWTRIECAHLTEEAEEKIKETAGGGAGGARGLQEQLAREFAADLEAASGDGAPEVRFESLYTGITEITGPALNDSTHFGQTIINNYGRPYERGFNDVTGFSGDATAGRFTIYVRGEYEHAPGTPALPDAAREFISTIDGTPEVPGTALQGTNQFRLLDTYVAAKAGDWNLAFGKQSLWWGPGEGSALLFSDNAAPIYMFRASRIAPFTLPWIFRWFGKIKVDLFFGKLSGNEYPARPLIHGEKITFKLTPNVELGFSRTVELGGAGRPFTFGHVWLSYVSTDSSNAQTPDTDPGKRTGGFDFTYRVPFARHWITLYADSLADDDLSPLSAPRRSGIDPGFYLARFPKIERLDLRVEAVNTNPTSSANHGHYIYFDQLYRQLYTNDHNIIGSWIGRQGQGLQAWSTYWIGERNSVQLGYRHAKVASGFVPGGETLNDGSVKVNWWLGENVNISAVVQYEKWQAPLLAPGPQTNWTSSVGVSFEPRGWRKTLRRGGNAESHGNAAATTSDEGTNP